MTPHSKPGINSSQNSTLFSFGGWTKGKKGKNSTPRLSSLQARPSNICNCSTHLSHKVYFLCWLNQWNSLISFQALKPILIISQSQFPSWFSKRVCWKANLCFKTKRKHRDICKTTVTEIFSPRRGGIRRPLTCWNGEEMWQKLLRWFWSWFELHNTGPSNDILTIKISNRSRHNFPYTVKILSAWYSNWSVSGTE